MKKNRNHQLFQIGCNQNKCSVGLETSIPEIEKLKAQLPFPREDFSFSRPSVARSNSSDRGKEKSSEGVWNNLHLVILCAILGMVIM